MTFWKIFKKNVNLDGASVMSGGKSDVKKD